MGDVRSIESGDCRSAGGLAGLVLLIGLLSGCRSDRSYTYSAPPPYMAHRIGMPELPLPARNPSASEPPARESDLPEADDRPPDDLSGGGTGARKALAPAIPSMIQHASFQQVDGPELPVPPAPPGEAGPDIIDPEFTEEVLRRRPPGVTLNQAIAETLANDPVLLATAEEIALAGGEFVTAGLLPNPTLSWIKTLLPLFTEFTPERQGGPPQLDIFVSYPVDWFLFGKRVAAMHAAQKGIDVAAAEVADTIRLRVTEAIVAYFDLLEANALLELAELDVENLVRVEEMTARLVELGAVGRVELDRVRLEVLASRRELRDARVVLAAARARLQRLMGRDAVEEFEIVGSLEVPHPVPPIEADEAFQLAETHRPDLIAARRQIDLAGANVRLEKKRAWPELNVEAGYSRQYQRRVLAMPDAHSWGFGFDVALPLHDRNQGGRLAAEAELRQAQHNYRAARLEARAEILETVEAFRQYHGIIVTEAPALYESATRVREAFEAAYRLGDRAFLEVLDAQRAFRETNRLLISGKAGYWRSLYRLNAAIGAQALK